MGPRWLVGVRWSVRSACLACALIAACSQTVISVLPAQTPRQIRAPVPVEVAVDATGVFMPMHVSGAGVAYSDVDRALARSLESALAAVFPRLSLASDQRLLLRVEILETHAEYAEGRLVVRMATRATLRRVRGNAYIAQTHAHTSHSALVSPQRGSSVVIACTDAISTELSGWLLGLELH